MQQFRSLLQKVYIQEAFLLKDNFVQLIQKQNELTGIGNLLWRSWYTLNPDIRVSCYRSRDVSR